MARRIGCFSGEGQLRNGRKSGAQEQSYSCWIMTCVFGHPASETLAHDPVLPDAHRGLRVPSRSRGEHLQRSCRLRGVAHDLQVPRFVLPRSSPGERSSASTRARVRWKRRALQEAPQLTLADIFGTPLVGRSLIQGQNVQEEHFEFLSASGIRRVPGMTIFVNIKGRLVLARAPVGALIQQRGSFRQKRSARVIITSTNRSCLKRH